MLCTYICFSYIEIKERTLNHSPFIISKVYLSRKPDKTSMDDDILDVCSLSKKPLEHLTIAERMVRCTREIADGSYLVRSEKTLKPDSETFNNALRAFDTHFT